MKKSISTAVAVFALIAFVAGAQAQSLLDVHTSMPQPSRSGPVATVLPRNPPVAAAPPPYVPPYPAPPAPGYVQPLPPTMYNPRLQGTLDQFLIAWAAWHQMPANHPQKAAAYQRLLVAKQAWDQARHAQSTIYANLPAAIAAFAVTYRVAAQWPINSTNNLAAVYRYQEAFKDIEKIAGGSNGPVNFQEINHHYQFWSVRLGSLPANNSVEREICRIAMAAYKKQWDLNNQYAQR